MSKIPTSKDIKQMSLATKAFRYKVCESSFLHFFAYYYRHFINSGFCQFHSDVVDDLMGLDSGIYTEVAEITYRGSAKTSFAKAFIPWCIAYKKYQYINVDSYDETNAERFLFDVVIELQTNRRLIDDYGQLFNAPSDSSQKTQKRVKDFICTNGVRVEAFSTQIPIRGRTHGEIRPQLLIADDFETAKTMVSEKITRKVRDHFNEGKPGMDVKRHSILWLGNYISDIGNVQWVIDKLSDNKNAKVRVLPIVKGAVPVWKNGEPEWEGNGIPTWPERFCMTDEEAVKNPDLVSLQQMRRDMYSPDTGEAEFLREMMCQPDAYSARPFKKSMFTPITFNEVKSRTTRVFFVVDSNGLSDDDDLTGKDRVGFTICWLERDGHWNLKSWGERIGPTAMLARIIDVHKWLEDEGTPCHRFAWEKTMFTSGLKLQFKEVQRKRMRMFPIYELKHTIKKEQRIKGSLQHRYETGMIRHIDGECKDLEKELLMMPDAIFDDVMDSAAMISEIVPQTFSVRVKSSDTPVSNLLG